MEALEATDLVERPEGPEAPEHGEGPAGQSVEEGPEDMQVEEVSRTGEDPGVVHEERADAGPGTREQGDPGPRLEYSGMEIEDEVEEANACEVTWIAAVRIGGRLVHLAVDTGASSRGSSLRCSSNNATRCTRRQMGT